MRLFQIVNYANILSLDVVTGALLSAFFASRLLCVVPEPVFWFVLSMSVWVVYTSDHLVDAYRLKENASTLRHLFHYRHFSKLLWMAVIFATSAVFLALLYLPGEIILAGMAIGLLTLGYLGLVHLAGFISKPFLQKELIVALVYTAGVWAGPLAIRAYDLSAWEWSMGLLFYLLAHSNALIFTICDSDSDRADRHPTLSTRYGLKLPFVVMISEISVVAFVCFLWIFINPSGYYPALLIYGLMAVATGVLIFFRKNLQHHLIYRTLAEMIFWIPGVILFV